MFLCIFLALVSIVSFVGAHAQTVAFVGGPLTQSWQQTPQFTANSNWQADGFSPNGEIGPCHETGPALTVVNQIIASGQRPIIHLLVGQVDADGSSDSNPEAFEMTEFEGCFAQVVQAVQSANLSLIVGTEPFAAINNIAPFNDFIYAYCAAHHVPVIDYYTAINRINSAVYWSLPGTGNVNYSYPTGTGPNQGLLPTMTDAGWTTMSNMAASAIAQAFSGLTMKAGYLGNAAKLAVPGEYLNVSQPEQDMNAVPVGTAMQWYAYGQYSDGSTREINNANVNGLYGTWFSTNPAVMKIDPSGFAWAISPGTANIKFTTLQGATINEWTMNVGKYCIEGPGC